MLIVVEKCIVKYLQELHPPKNLSEKGHFKMFEIFWIFDMVVFGKDIF